jgi:nicotinamide phosphoribosyltransferase
MNPLLWVDFYKTEHFRMMPDGTTMIYSNFTPRKSRIKGVDAIVFFGLQHFILETLIKAFQTEFFGKTWAELDAEYQEEIHVNTDHIKALHELQYLPIIIKALPEGLN